MLNESVKKQCKIMLNLSFIFLLQPYYVCFLFISIYHLHKKVCDNQAITVKPVLSSHRRESQKMAA